METNVNTADRQGREKPTLARRAFGSPAWTIAQTGKRGQITSTKWIPCGAIALVFLCASAGLYHQEKLVRLWNVNSMFDKDRIVSNFSNMKEMFQSVPMPNRKAPFVWRRQPATLPVA